MIPVSDALIDLLNRQKLAQERTAIRQAHGIGAGLPWREKTDPLTARPGEGREPMGMGKGRGTVKAPPVDQEVGSVSTRKPSPANGRPVPHIVVDNSRCLTMAKPHHGAPREVMVKHLRLVVSN